MLWDKRLPHSDMQGTLSAFLPLCIAIKRTSQMTLGDFTFVVKHCSSHLFLFFHCESWSFWLPRTNGWKLLWTNESPTREICEWTTRSHPACTSEFCFLCKGQVQTRSQHSCRFQDHESSTFWCASKAAC